MMDWTDRHCRAFHRVLSRRAVLYTEMVTAPALVRGGARHLLRFDAREHPVVLQLGGSDPRELAEAARMGEAEGYDGIDLNCGCPSDRVQSGTFGAVLMREPARVADCVDAMRAAVRIEVSVKCRIGVDEQDPSEALPRFLEAVCAAGIRSVTVHARKAWLKGLSPKENRDVPPLDYGLVARMRAAFPQLRLTLNGGIRSLEAAEAHLAEGFESVMIGRAAYERPGDILLPADERLHGQTGPVASREEAVAAMEPHIAAHLAEGGRLSDVTRHMLGLFAGRPGARAWRRHLSEEARRPGAGLDVLREALALVNAAGAAPEPEFAAQ